MANVTFNSIASSTSTAGNFKASEMWSSHATYTGNFNAVTDQVNGNLDSINYSVSGFQSSNIAKNAILSQHITNNAVLSDKIGDGAIVDNHMNFQSTDSGVRAVQIGKAGLKYHRYEILVTTTITAGATGYYGFLVSFAGSRTASVIPHAGASYTYTVTPLDGDPGFTENPVMLRAAQSHGGAATQFGLHQRITSLNSISCEIEFFQTSAGTGNYPQTFHLAAVGR